MLIRMFVRGGKKKKGTKNTHTIQLVYCIIRADFLNVVKHK